MTTDSHFVIDVISKQCHKTSREHGFWDHEIVYADNTAMIVNPSIVGEKLALIHSEVSEVLEEARDNGDSESMLEELADVCIRVFDLAEWIHTDTDDTSTLGEAIRDKMVKNQDRPYMHGKKVF